MTHQELTTSFERLVTKMRETLLKKGKDYANEDTMSNFKRVGGVTDQTPEKVILTFIASKTSRLSNLMEKGTKPENESLQDNALDLACYGMLLYSCLEETIENSKK
jgi:hypothetical protein